MQLRQVFWAHEHLCSRAWLGVGVHELDDHSVLWKALHAVHSLTHYLHVEALELFLLFFLHGIQSK
jgi:hypothetical protein